MKATAELKMLPVSVLKPAAYNPRKKLKPGDKEYEKIKNSITEFGFADPLVVNADMTIIGGHQRLTVAMELGSSGRAEEVRRENIVRMSAMPNMNEGIIV